jgi:hypothetical protein
VSGGRKQAQCSLLELLGVTSPSIITAQQSEYWCTSVHLVMELSTILIKHPVMGYSKYYIVTWYGDYRWGLDGWLDLFIQPVTTPHRSLLHTDQCSQSHCFVTASNGRHSSANGLMSSQACDHLTRTAGFSC